MLPVPRGLALATVALAMVAPGAKEKIMTHTANNHRIDYIEWTAPDLPKVKAFYQEAFGWSFTDYGPDYTAFEDGRLSGGFARAPIRPGGSLIVLYAVELEATQRRIEKAGGTIAKPIFSFPGGRRFHFRDPAGNELAVWSDRA